jgi:hypothetical protein
MFTGKLILPSHGDFGFPEIEQDLSPCLFAYVHAQWFESVGIKRNGLGNPPVE